MKWVNRIIYYSRFTEMFTTNEYFVIKVGATLEHSMYLIWTVEFPRNLDEIIKQTLKCLLNSQNWILTKLVNDLVNLKATLNRFFSFQRNSIYGGIQKKYVISLEVEKFFFFGETLCITNKKVSRLCLTWNNEGLQKE